MILLLTTDGTIADAQVIKEVILEKKATLVSFQFITVPEIGFLDKNEFLNWHYRNGVDLSNIDRNFQLRDIILLKNADTSQKSNFIFLYLWNWPESTYNIDKVRIPHPPKYDKRNNPLGKNPGNIWAFSNNLDNGKEIKEKQKIDFKNHEKICHKQVDVDALKRLIRCHTLDQDEVLYICEAKDRKIIVQVIKDLGRNERLIQTSSADTPKKYTVLTTEYPIAENQEVQPHGLSQSDPKASYYFTDSRYGIANLISDSIDDVVTSPPYNIDYDPFNVPKPDPKTGKLVKPNKKGYKDNLPVGQYHSLLKTVMCELDRKLNPSSSDVFFNLKNNYSNGFCLPAFWILSLIPDGWQFTDLLIWRYDISYDPARNKYKPYYEWVFRFSKGKPYFKPKHTFLKDFYLPILKGNSKEREGLKHPAIYPRKLVEICLNESNHSGLVVDPFLGSGSTLIAAFELNRPSIGFEINKEYKEDIEKQFAKINQINNS